MEFNVTTYAGNVRVDAISRDVLMQIFEGDADAYNDAEYPHYINLVGKIGVFVEWLHAVHGTRVVIVEFSNGEQIILPEYDLSPTDQPVTPEEFLPVLYDVEDTSNYVELSDSEKDFADRVYLTLLAAHVTENNIKYIPQQELWGTAIDSAQHRERFYAMRWSQE